MSNPPRNIRAENEYLRKALALRRKLQKFIDSNAGRRGKRTEQFTLDGENWNWVTRIQKRTLMEMAPEDVRKANEKWHRKT